MALMPVEFTLVTTIILALALVPWVCLAFGAVSLPPARQPFLARPCASTTAADHVVDGIRFEPCQVILDQVSLQYPVTLARRLFSSVPRRDFAVYNVSLTLQQEIVLLQGASSSGKSALMKLIAGHESPTQGTVDIKGGATPIWLADKPDQDNQHSVQHLLQKETRNLVNAQDDSSLGDDEFPITAVTNAFCRLVHLDPSSKSFQQTPFQLSPSENYKIRLAMACLQSSLPGLRRNNSGNTEMTTLPAPILLLDEWLDAETRDASSKIEQALLELVQSTGAVILCATHKPNLWKKLAVADSSSQHTTQITMCRGEILTLMQPTKREKPPN